MRNLWRLHIRPYGGNGDTAASVALCLDRRIIGMGWAVPEEEVSRSTELEWFKEAAGRQYGENTSWHSVWTFAESLQLHDLVWFRNLEGRFYLAEIIGPWQYAYHDEAAIDADVVNFRKARIIEVGLADAVPGKIVACFRPSRTFQAIRSPGMLAFSEKLAGMPVTGDVIPDVFEFMSDADLENLVFVYLQFLGWYVLPGTHTATTAHYEFVLVGRERGERAVVQVKSGHTGIDASQYAGEEKAFLFATSGSYGAEMPPNVVIITREDLNSFMKSMPQLLPRAVST
jgi:hypothetical protein